MPTIVLSVPTLRALLATAVLAAAGAGFPAVALADGTAVVADCVEDSKLDKTYTPAEYKDALQNIPTDVREYTDCEDVIRRAQRDKAAGGTGTDTGTGSGVGGTGAGGGGDGTAGGSGGAAVDEFDAALAGASDEERAAFQAAVAGTDGPGVMIAGRPLRADSLGSGDLGTLNSLPTPFVLVLLLLAGLVVAATFPTLRDLVRTRRRRTVA